MTMNRAERDAVADILERAFAEDIGAGDVTSQTVIPAELEFAGVMTAREPMTIAGLSVAQEAFNALDPNISFTALVGEGDRVEPGTEIARIEGPARALLGAERTALNLLQNLSGIATLTRCYVDAIAGTGATLLDTRKTIPGLRRLAKYATRVGGATNHRMGLFDGILIKDNHIAVCGSITDAVARALANRPAGIEVEVECDTLDQVAEAVSAGADMVLLDNMPPDVLRQALAITNGQIKTEASGGITLKTIRAIAETGVDYVSVGALTHSVRAVDIGLDWSTRT